MRKPRPHHLALGALALALLGCGPAKPPKPTPPPLFPAPESGEATIVPPTPLPVVANSATQTPVPEVEPIVEPPVEPVVVAPVVAPPPEEPAPLALTEPLKPTRPKLPDAPVPNWIWLPVPDGSPAFIRRRFGSKGKITRALLKVACDGAADVFLNGIPVVHVRDGSITLEADRYLHPGNNAIAIIAQKEGGSGAVAVWMNYLGPDGANILQTDTTWQGKHKPEPGWTQSDLVGRGWFQVSDLGPVGAAERAVPKAMEDLKLIPTVPRQPPRQPAAADSLKLRRDFHAETLYLVPKEQGSWITICAEPTGSFICGAHGGGLYRLTPRNNRPNIVQPVPTVLTGAQGLLHHQGALYVAANREGHSGVYRLRDTTGDGNYDEETLLKALDATGEHGIHGIVPSSDGKRLFLTVGNRGKLPTAVARERITEPWANDSLLADMGQNHNPDFKAPGGYICSFDLEGKDWQLHSVGYRNCYDLTFNRRGDLFAFDADAENDAGAPWYRPNRLVHVTSGSDFGWRPGVHKWQDHRPDTLPTLLESRRGSPASLFSGANAAFPPRYRNAIFLVDWARGALDAAWVTPEGASYTATQETFIAGEAFPIVDGIIAPDGSMLLVSGGRFLPSAVYRIRYTGPEQPADPPEVETPDADSARGLRKSLEFFHGLVHPEAVAKALAHLDHSDRHIRYAARLALEAQPIEIWRDKALAHETALGALTGALAVTRRGSTDDLSPLLTALARFKFPKLNPVEKQLLLRSYSLASLRLGGFEKTQTAALLKGLSPHFPDPNDEVDKELASLLAHLSDPTLLPRILLLLGGEPTAARSDARAVIGQKLSGKQAEWTLSLRQVHYAGLLRRSSLTWTDAQRARYFDWLNRAAHRGGGSVYSNVIYEMRRDALAALGDAAEPYKNPPQLEYRPENAPAIPTALGPGRAWSLDEAAAVIGDGPRNRDYENAKSMFTAAQCVHCHRVGDQGGVTGPDLSTLAGRFTTQDILESIIHPSKVISDQFNYQRVTLVSGIIHYGRPAGRDDTTLKLAINPYDGNDVMSIPIAEIASEVPAEISPMPPALINILNPEELRDLMAYLVSGGNPEAEHFSQPMRSPGPPPPPPASAFEADDTEAESPAPQPVVPEPVVPDPVPVETVPVEVVPVETRALKLDTSEPVPVDPPPPVQD